MKCLVVGHRSSEKEKSMEGYGLPDWERNHADNSGQLWDIGQFSIF